MSDLAERLLDYGARIVKLVSALPPTLIGRRIGDQLLRSGTAVGANYEEARAAESEADFVHKLQVAFKGDARIQFLVKAFGKSRSDPQRAAGAAD